ncbi:cell division protein FtsW [Arcanobacterium wilhelmae]|uniref:Probable peptidoglycan glycosyltransferase FtsW n=1 Tax=Arcanobacterium wilhelmae TaxID=1803177 RepID=A0ABT9N9R6_9ACTO|nr:putative peptidoglycan glycosyltransferase FtsW [Arcanobacterium wilhelmae]MDP9800250.1 cell division protein FtsW [Arcanobacterium wilhelmae]WFN89689.1 putative peptidoglycan glycosyltransferase FtsW [Arcanobacterium wilhelmae]
MSVPLNAADRRVRDIMTKSLIVMVVSTIVLVALGVFMVFSATAPSSIRLIDADPTAQLFSVAIKQAGMAVFGMIVALALMKWIPAQLVKFAAKGIFAFALILQGSVFVLGSRTVGGNTNWLRLGPISIQPSEFLKVALIIWLAYELSQRSVKQMADWRQLIQPIVGFVVAIGLVLLGGDVGTGLIFILIAVGLALIAGIPLRLFVIPGVLGALAVGMLIAIRPSRVNRIGDFLSNFWNLPDTHAPTQADYALFAFGSGGVPGVGIGAGKEKWRDLAEAHTDFIFAVIGEELGFLGALTVIALFVALGWALVRICLHHPDRYAQFVAAGAALWLIGQGVANMFVVTGLLPVFGVPLPFVSMGGSSMLAGLIMLGVVAGTVMQVPGVRESLRVNPRLAASATSVLRRNR